MSDNITLSDVSGGYNLSVINTNFQKIENVLNTKVLFRDTTNPNEMDVSLDMNGNRILNVSTIDSDNVTVGGMPLSEVISNLAINVNPQDVTIARYRVNISVGTTFITLPEVYNGPASSLIVFKNGVQQPTSHYTFNGQIVTFTTPLISGDTVEIVYFKHIGFGAILCIIQFAIVVFFG